MGSIPNDAGDDGAPIRPDESFLLSAAVDGDYRDEVWDALRELGKEDALLWERFAETYRADLALRGAVREVGDHAVDAVTEPTKTRDPWSAGRARTWMGWAAALAMAAVHLSSSSGDHSGVGSSVSQDGGSAITSSGDGVAGRSSTASRRPGFVVVRPSDGSGLRVGRVAVDDLGRPSVVPVANHGVVRVESM